ncbi:hypothetical protein TSAR_011497 [Trichomalopsis sarcophagae]|uniref:Uncharacterized protein n=1 Tax=Trichomalopsis sarcophagae TaxID=543379 RepID=A0A232FJY2_9HYME|nr:hypothetical protein TSAR_011497 [Trichomalopsis sarcophagae]
MVSKIELLTKVKSLGDFDLFIIIMHVNKFIINKIADCKTTVISKKVKSKIVSKLISIKSKYFLKVLLSSHMFLLLPKLTIW